jgi:ABC-type sulfate transport system substrate-binding protein
MMIRNNNGINLKMKKIGAVLFGILVVTIMAYFGQLIYFRTSDSPVRLVVYAFSTQEEALTQGIFPAFMRSWETDTGEEIDITGVFGPSGILAGQINLGAPADIVIFSNISHLNFLRISRMLPKEIQPIYFGNSPIVIITRPGNPYNIDDFSDLSQSNLILVQPDPRSSGAGEWGLLAEYGSSFLKTGNNLEALKQVDRIWQNVRVMTPSARSALTLFEFGAGDALITYEQDAILAQDRGVDIDIIIPSPTILSEPVAIAVDKNITRSERPAVKAFLDFLTSPDGQVILSSFHMRTSEAASQLFSDVNMFTCEEIGGWTATYTQVVKQYWEREILPELLLDDYSYLFTREKQ